MKATPLIKHLPAFLLSMLAAVSLVAVLALAGCSSSGDSASTDSGSDTAASNDGSYTLVEDGKLTVAASLDFPPFENLVDGQAEGFEVDLMTAIAEQLGLEINYLPTMKFDTIIPAIAAGGTADVGVSGFTITPEREEEVDFSTPICDTNQCIVVPAGSDITSQEDLSGKNIGAESGTTGYDWILENVPDAAQTTAFDEYTAVFAALQSGQVEAVVLDMPVAEYYINSAYGDCEIVEEIPTGEQYGIAVSKDNPNLTAAINQTIADLQEDGTFAEIEEKWFGSQE